MRHNGTMRLFLAFALFAAIPLLAGCPGKPSEEGSDYTIDMRTGESSLTADGLAVTAELVRMLRHYDTCDNPPSLVGVYYSGNIRVRNISAGYAMVDSFDLRLFGDSGRSCFSRSGLGCVWGDIDGTPLELLPARVPWGREVVFSIQSAAFSDAIEEGCFAADGGTACDEAPLLQHVTLHLQGETKSFTVRIVLDRTGCWRDGDRCTAVDPRPDRPDAAEAPGETVEAPPERPDAPDAVEEEEAAEPLPEELAAEEAPGPDDSPGEEGDEEAPDETAAEPDAAAEDDPADEDAGAPD